MSQKPNNWKIDPTDVISSIFTARRDLLHAAKWCIQKSGLTIEEADLLVSLYGVRKLGWDDLDHDSDFFVAYSQLERYLVHNPSLLSRRIRKLASHDPPLLEVATAEPGSGLHFNAKRVRITPEGIRRTEPIWKRFEKASSTLLEGISKENLRSHLSVNQMISGRIHNRLNGLISLFEGS